MNELLIDINNNLNEYNAIIDNYAFLKNMLSKFKDYSSNKHNSNNFFSSLKYVIKDITVQDMCKLGILLTNFYDIENNDKIIKDLTKYIDIEDNVIKETRYNLLLEYMCIRLKDEKDELEDLKEEDKQKYEYLKENIKEYEKALQVLFCEETLEKIKQLSENKEFAQSVILGFYLNKMKSLEVTPKNLLTIKIEILNKKDLPDPYIYHKNNIDIIKLYFYIINMLRKETEKFIKEVNVEVKKIIKLRNKTAKDKQKLEEIFASISKDFLPSNKLSILFNSGYDIESLENITKISSHLALKEESTLGSKEKTLLILEKYGYSLNNLVNIDFSYINLKTLEDNLKKLSNNNIILNDENLLKIINNETIIDSDNFIHLFQRNYINNNIINDNINILTNSTVFNNYVNNTILLNNLNIDVSDLVKRNYQVLFINNNYLSNLLNLYSKYDININNDNIILLIDSTNLDLVDKYIEEGIEYVKNETSYLEYGESLVKRIHIENLIGSDLNIFKLNDTLFSENSFFVSDKYLDASCCNQVSKYQDKYIAEKLDNSERITISDEINDCELVKKLDDKYLENDNFDINGIKISRLKVLRNLEALKEEIIDEKVKVFNSIIYNSLLSSDYIDIILEEVDTLYTVKTYNKTLNKKD